MPMSQQPSYYCSHSPKRTCRNSKALSFVLMVSWQTDRRWELLISILGGVADWTFQMLTVPSGEGETMSATGIRVCHDRYTRYCHEFGTLVAGEYGVTFRSRHAQALFGIPQANS